MMQGKPVKTPPRQGIGRNTMKNDITCIALIIVCTVAVIAMASVIKSPVAAPMGGTFHAAPEQPDTYLIIDRNIDASGMIILDFAINGEPRSAYFQSMGKCDQYVNWLESRGSVEFLGVSP